MAEVTRGTRVMTLGGRMLTEEIAARLADEIETDREVRWAARRPVGRPPGDRETVVPRRSYRVPDELHRKLQARANRDRRTVSELACQALEELLGE